ncbi:MAG: glycosyltransferase [Deltaproteobacteria bacterium]|nr:glycosyltransferase [Deltaproteobacteria bacterium]
MLCNPSSKDRIMIIAPHPDDETLAAGGLIQKAIAAQAAVRIVFVTNGGNNPWPQCFSEAKLKLSDADHIRWGKMREKEAMAALKTLDLHDKDIEFLNLPDQGLTGILLNSPGTFVNRLADIFKAWRPTMVICPDISDLHPDHNAAGVMCIMALNSLPDDRDRPGHATYLVHFPKNGSPGRMRTAIPLSQKETALKQQAILCYKTQLILSRSRMLSYAKDREMFLTPHPARDAKPVIRKRNTSPDMDVACVIPCYNTEGFCGPVIRDAAMHAGRIIAVNDGSIDHTGRVLHEIASELSSVDVIDFPTNRGKGHALMAGIRHTLNMYRFNILVTMDSDGQHCPDDIPALVRPMEDGADMVIGERDFTKMPARSLFGNMIISYLMRSSFPGAPRDTQSGFRAFNREFVSNIHSLMNGSGYETELYMLIHALKNNVLACVPIKTIYLDKNRSSHFRPIIDSLKMLYAFKRQIQGTGLGNITPRTGAGTMTAAVFDRFRVK